MPVNAAGWRMDPPVSVPSEAKHCPAATAAAEPPLLPPGMRVRSQGFFVFLKCELSVEEREEPQIAYGEAGLVGVRPAGEAFGDLARPTHVVEGQAQGAQSA